MARSGVIRESHKPVLPHGPQGEMEEWRPVPGMEDLYIASSLGRVARMVGHASAAGYRHVCVPRKLVVLKGHSMGASTKHRNHYRVFAHHLVALAFLGAPPEGKTQVNHKDLNRSNNRCTNLEWCNQQENLAHWRKMRPGVATCDKPWKSSVSDWQAIRRLCMSGVPRKEVAAKFGLTVSGVRWILKSPKYREAA